MTNYIGKLKQTKQLFKMYIAKTLKPVCQCSVKRQKKYSRTSLFGAAQQSGLIDVNYNFMRKTQEPFQTKAHTNTVLTTPEGVE